MSRLIGLLVFMALSGVIFGISSSDAFANKKAVVMGVGKYINVTPLNGPVFDAKSIYDEFVSLGFNSTLLDDDDMSTQKYPLKWGEFLDTVQAGDDVVIYYSGHGVEIGGANYIVPQDVLPPDDFPNEVALARSLISIRSMTDDLVAKQARAIVWIIDACRDNPFAQAGTVKALGQVKGLAAESSPVGTFIFYAAGFGETALAKTGVSGENSLYTGELLTAIKSMATKPVYQIAVAVRTSVRDKARPHQQRPAYYDGLDGTWCFADCERQEVQISLNTVSEVIAVKSLNTSNDIEKSTSALPPEKQASLEDERTGNAVFIGRASFIQSCTSNSPDDRAPFGCDLLKKVEAGDLKGIIGSTITPVTEVNIRRGPPLPNVDGSFAYQCSVGVLSRKVPTSFSSVTTEEQGGDRFFWGTLQSQALDCDGSPLNASSGATPMASGVADPKLKALVDQ
jgi:hypothetical protein